MDQPKAETNGVVIGNHSNDNLDSKVNDATKLAVKSAPSAQLIPPQGVVSSNATAAQSMTTDVASVGSIGVTQQTLMPSAASDVTASAATASVVPKVMRNANRTAKRSAAPKSNAVTEVSRNTRDNVTKRVTRHSKQSPPSASSSPKKVSLSNSQSSSLSSSPLYNVKLTVKDASVLPVAHKRSPSSPIPPPAASSALSSSDASASTAAASLAMNKFSGINASLVRATKSLPTPANVNSMPLMRAQLTALSKQQESGNDTNERRSKRKKKDKNDIKAKKVSDQLNEPSRASKRVRLQYQPFQSPEPLLMVPLMFSSSVSLRDTPEDKVLVYSRNEFLAVRNENNSFFICKTAQNVYKNSRKIKIQWFNNDKNANIYTPDFYDHTDFETVLTNLTLDRVDRGQYMLPDDERQRISNILQRALNVEKGINVPPDPSQVAADGVDVSVIGKAEEKELLKRISLKRSHKLSDGITNSPSSSLSRPKEKLIRKKSKKTKTDDKNSSFTTPVSSASSNSTKSGIKVILRRSTRSAGSGKSPSLSPTYVASTKVSPKRSKPGIADVVKRLKTRARSAKKAAVAAAVTAKKFSVSTKRQITMSAKKKTPAKASPKTTSKAETTKVKSKTSSPKVSAKIVLPKNKRKTIPLLQSNSHVTLYDRDPTFESTVSIPFISTISHSKLLIRAVLLRDYNLLETLMRDEKNVCSFCIPRSLEVNRDALSYAIQNEDIKAIQMLTDEKIAENLAQFPDLVIDFESTGHGSKHMFGHALRTVNVGRGGREGNNALIRDRNLYSEYGCSKVETYFSADHIKEALKFNIKISTIDKMAVLMGQKNYGDSSLQLFFEYIVVAIKNGHRKLASELIERAIKRGGFGFNVIHREALLSGKKFSLFRPTSVCKKAIGNSRITPIHCAAINPDPYYISTLFASRPEYSITDSDLWMPIHYAAVCEGTGPLEYLLSLGISSMAVDKEGNTPLHLACRTGRAHNVEVINRHEKSGTDGDAITGSSSSIERANRSGMTALHISSRLGYADVVKALLKSGADAEKTTPAANDKLTPLMIASQYGHLPIVKLLFEGGVNVEMNDKKGRTALSHAVINGHAHIVSYLLRLGADPNTKDTSGNTLVHYAAAYGWYFCFKLLMEAKARPDYPNDWKMTPLCIAFMKGHTGLAEEIIKEPGVDVNLPINDTSGITLLLQTCNSKPNEIMLNRLKFLVEKYNADCVKTDFEANNALHYLVRSEFNQLEHWNSMEDDALDDAIRDKQKLIIIESAQFLIDRGCDPSAVNKKKMTPFMLATQLGCFAMMQKLIECNKQQLTAQPNDDGNTILHLFIKHATDGICIKKNMNGISVGRFLKELYESDDKLKPIFKSMTEIYNNDGLTPLQLLLKTYVKKLNETESDRLIDYVRFLTDTLCADVNSTVKHVKPIDSNTTVLHLAAQMENPEIVKHILLKKPNLEPMDGNKRTPLAVAINAKNAEIGKLFINSGCDVKFRSACDYNRPLLLIEASNNHNNFELIPLLVQKGADVKEHDKKSGNTVLHYVSMRAHLMNSLEAVVSIIAAGADVNAVNLQGRTALHLAVNSRHGETDVSYDVEDYLLKSGAKTDIRDYRGRIPLHYAFVKIDNFTDSNYMDPIELVALLDPLDSGGAQRSAIDISDHFGSTPLHYAAQRGATISCMHLLRRAVNINPIDNYDNTPLGLAVLYNHEGCALMLQQKGACFTSPVGNMNTRPELLRKDDKETRWKWSHIRDEKRRKHEIDARDARCPIIQEVVRNDWQGLLYLMINELATMGRGVGIAIEAALKTNRLKLAIKLLKRVKQNRTLNIDKHTLIHILAKQNHQCNEQINCLLQNEILKLLIEHEVSHLSLDSSKSMAIIYAAINWNSHLCNELTNIMGWDRVMNLERDDYLRTPLTAIFWNIASSGEIPEEMQKWCLKFIEKGSNLNILCHYPIVESPFPGVRCYTSLSHNLPVPSSSTLLPSSSSSSQKYSPLIVAVIKGNYNIVKYLLNLKKNGSYAVDVNYTDDVGRTPLMHAVRLNDIKMVKLLLNRSYCPEKDRKPLNSRNLTFKNTNNVDLSAKDRNGNTVMHHLVEPLPELSYVNSDIILTLLWHVSVNAKSEVPLIDVSNSLGETPLMIAKKRCAKSLIETLQRLANNSGIGDNDNDKTLDSIELPSLPKAAEVKIGISSEFDFKDDFMKMMEKLNSEITDTDDEPIVKPDGLIAIDDAEVLIDTQQNIPYDVLLTKVDIEFGSYGLYNFYKMQIVQQKSRGLILLFTRWGRIGDIGQYQKTPFPVMDDAIKEFKKIFKSKSGNLWDNVKQSFNHVPKKYRLVNHMRMVRKKEKRYKIDVNDAINSIDSVLPTPLFELMKTLIGIYSNKNVIRRNGTEESSLPFGLVKRETLESAEKILEKIEILINERNEMKNRTSADYSKITDEIIELSEEFYYLVPTDGYQFDRLMPLFDHTLLREKMELISNLLHYEFATELIFAAQFRSNELNPADYVFNCLRCGIEQLDPSCDESQLILQYIHNTGPHVNNVKGIYRITRNGEDEQLMKSAAELGNHWLLWHGTKDCNVMSILSRGLQIAPIGAELSGHLFGKGIYFADSVAKSIGYCNGYGTEFSSSKFMFLCEASLGNVQDMKLNDNSKKNALKKDCHSLKTCDSRYQNDPSVSVYWKGRTVPLGPSVESEDDFEEHQYYGLNYNEYVVFDPKHVCLRYLVHYSDERVKNK